MMAAVPNFGPGATRVLLRLVAVVLVTATLAGCDRIADRQIESALSRVRTDLLTSPDMHVILCGTGSPLPDRTRAGACTAVIAGGEFVLVDIGPGSWETVDLANLPTAAVSAILLTHFHSDHIGDLGEAVTQSWIAGRTRPLDVYGPAGTGQVVDGFRLAYAQDVNYRVAHHGEEYMPRAAGVPVAHEVPLADGPTASAVVFERNGLKVTMFRVDHAPVVPAVGYRFDYRGRSVVVSGDTRKSDSVIQHAAGADILIHEALNPQLMGRAAEVADRLGKKRLAKLARDILTYHTSLVEAAEVAKAAGVKHLVLTHLVPGPTNFLARRLFTRGMADHFDGTITLGEDGMELTLTPAS
jgi:ribonuclease Z